MGAIPGNLLPYNDESVETSIANWSAGGNSSVAWSAAFAREGSRSVAVTSTASGAAYLFGFSPSVTAAVSYQYFYAVYTTVAGLSATAHVDWYNGASFLSGSDGSSTPLVQNGWTWVTLSANAAASATVVHLVPAFTATAGGQVAYLDEIYFGPPTSFPVFSADLATAYAGTAADLGAPGTWVTPANAQGTPDGAYATWAVP